MALAGRRIAILRRLKRRLPLGVTIGGVVGAAVWLLSTVGLFERLENDTFDARARLLHRESAADSSIVIVAIDDNSIEAFRTQLGRWPWPREAHAQILAYLTAAGARLVVFDVAFPEPDALRPSGDTVFAGQIAASGRVVLPMTVQPGDSADAALWEANLGLEGRRALMERFAVGSADAAPGVQDFPYAEPADPLFLAQAAATGTILLNADGDGVTRRTVPAYVSRGRVYANVALAAAREVQPERYASPVASLSGRELALENGTRMPLDRGTRVLRWHGRYLHEGASTYRTFRAADVMLSYNQVALGERTAETADVPFSALANKVVFVATTAVGTFEPRATPLAPNDPGVMIHATTLDNYLNDAFLDRAPAVANAAVTVLPAVLAGGAVVAVGFVSLGALATLLLLGALALLGAWSYTSGVWLDLAAPITATVLSFAGVMSVNYFTEGRERRRVKELFSRYVSPMYVSQLADHYEAIKLGGERLQLTVMFSDIRGFTAMSEKLPPDAVISMLNEYLERMVAVVFKHGGTLDKFIGDAVMAFWGAPIPVKDHAHRAVDAALEMMEELHALNRRWAEEGSRSRLDIGIGVNTGEAVVGNIGSLAYKVEYTVIGDTVNLANRLEGLNKEHGTNIIISEGTKLAVGDDFDVRPLPDTKVKGKEQAVRIFEVLGRRSSPRPHGEAKRPSAAGVASVALLALCAAAAAPAYASAQDKERWVDFVYRPGRWNGRQLVALNTTDPATDSLALIARVDTYVRAPRWRAEVRRMLPGDSVPDLTVLVGNGEDVVVLTAVGSTPLAQHQAATDSVVSSVVSRFQAGRPLRPEGGRFVDRGANNRVARVVVRQQQERGDFADNLLDARPAGGALGLVGLGVQSLAPGRNQEVVASAGPRGVARVRTVDGEIAVNPDTVAVVNMRRRSANYFDLDAFLRELRLGMYAQPGRQEERR